MPYIFSAKFAYFLCLSRILTSFRKDKVPFLEKIKVLGIKASVKKSSKGDFSERDDFSQMKLMFI